MGLSDYPMTPQDVGICRRLYRRSAGALRRWRARRATSARQVMQNDGEATGSGLRRGRLGALRWRSAGQAPLLSLARKLYKRLRPHRWIFAVAVAQVLLIGA